MFYLYHKVPENMQGHTLYPLNTLKDVFPAIYQQQIQKYVGREHITEQTIPILNCLWSDALHFSPVPPSAIKQALIDAGRPEDFVMHYYQVDPKLINPSDAVIYLYAHTDDTNKLTSDNFIPYSPEAVEGLATMPEATKQYYVDSLQAKNKPLLYHRIPHILYKGTLDVSKIPVISV